MRTCEQCKKWTHLSRGINREFCGYAIPTDRTGLCAYELGLGIMSVRPKWRQGDDKFAEYCPAFMKGVKHGKRQHIS